MENKRGASEWSVGKLLTIIMVLVLIALVIFGLYSGTLTPLIEKMGEKFDVVVSLFKAGEEAGGESFTKKLIIDGKDATLMINEEECVIYFKNGGAYRVDYSKNDAGEFQKLEGKKWEYITEYSNQDVKEFVSAGTPAEEFREHKEVYPILVEAAMEIFYPNEHNPNGNVIDEINRKSPSLLFNSLEIGKLYEDDSDAFRKMVKGHSVVFNGEKRDLGVAVKGRDDFIVYIFISPGNEEYAIHVGLFGSTHITSQNAWHAPKLSTYKNGEWYSTEDYPSFGTGLPPATVEMSDKEFEEYLERSEVYHYLKDKAGCEPSY